MAFGVSVNPKLNWTICAYTLTEDVLKYSLECMKDGRFKITKKLSVDETGDTHSYTLEKNRFSCNATLCLVLCPDCPQMSGCVHQFTCDCKGHAYRKLCKHSHLLSLLRHANGSNTEPSPSDVVVINDQQQSDCSNRSNEEQPMTPSLEDDSVAVFLRRLTKVEAKIQTFKEMMVSDGVSLKEKCALMKAVVPIEEVSVPPQRNPSSFPRLSRKKTHSPQKRSLFPPKKKVKFTPSNIKTTLSTDD